MIRLYFWLQKKVVCVGLRPHDLVEIKVLFVSTLSFDKHFSGEFDIVKTLIENGADVNAGNSRRWTPLHVASKNGISSTITLDYWFNIIINNGFSFISMGLHQGHITIVRLLIENGANVDATTNLGWTPLHLASRIDNDNSSKLCEIWEQSQISLLKNNLKIIARF